MTEDVEEYRTDEGDFECPECEARYEDKETFRLHVEYCGESP